MHERTAEGVREAMGPLLVDGEVRGDDEQEHDARGNQQLQKVTPDITHFPADLLG